LRLELGEYFRGRRKEFTVPVEYPGSPFQKKVWNELRRVPYGATIAYEDLARRVRSPRAARAVGRSNGLNRIAILIPCHRVLNKGGGLGGYGGGLWRKQALLELERGGPARRRGIHAAVNARALQRHTRPEGLLSKAG
jgi:AraC family transcriptional regulator of adaptative response/methylated-DNA-[protein]-cysteine methyltransferase